MRDAVQQLRRDQPSPALRRFPRFTVSACASCARTIEQLQAGYSRSFTIYDQDDSTRLIKNCIKDLGYDEKFLGQRATQSAISAAKNRGDDVEAFAAAQNTSMSGERQWRGSTNSTRSLQQNNALDFDDLMIKTVRLLRTVPQRAREIQQQVSLPPGRRNTRTPTRCSLRWSAS